MSEATQPAPSNPLILESKQNGVATLTLNRPDKLNALNKDLAVALNESLGRIVTDKSIYVVVITGAGRAFCAGGDLAVIGEGRKNNDTTELEPLLRAGLSDLVGMVASVPGIDDIALTTNGSLLARYAEPLRAAGLTRITVSLDTLDADTFASVAGDFVPTAQRRDTVMSILTEMGLASKADTSTLGLSQVELRKMELARAMATHPKLLISDEAMAGLSSSEVDEVLDLLIKLASQGITIIMIEHIMQAVMRFSERMMCLDAGKIIAIGAPAEVMANQRVQEAYLGT